jgi:hypothetical protein
VSSEELELVRRLQVEDHEDYVNVSKHIAESVKDYNEFAQEWRTHFVETMKPKHMPEMWKVDRKTENVWIPLRVLKQHQIT